MFRSQKLCLLWSWYIYALLAAFHITGHAQTPTDSLHYYVQHLDATNGLVHDQFNAFISTDSKGFQWISSSTGCYRFDGKTFTNYLPERDSLQTLVQSNFFEDTLGRIWFSTLDALNCYNYKTDAVTSKVFAKAPHNYSGSYHIVWYDQERHELLLSNSQALWAYRPGVAPQTKELSPTNSIRYLTIPADGTNLVLGFPWLMGAGMERYEINNGEIINHSWSKNKQIKSTRINGGVTDHLNRVWLGTEAGLIHYDVILDTVLGTYPSPDQSSKEVWSPVVFQDKLAVSTAQSGVWLFNPSTKQYENALGANALATGDSPDKSPRALHVTPTGTLFAMCREEGIDVYSPVPNPAQEVFDLNDRSLSVSGIAADRFDQIWVATMQGDIYLLGTDGSLRNSFEHIFNESNPIHDLQVTNTKNQVLAQSEKNIFSVFYDRDRRAISIDTLASFDQTIEGFTVNSAGDPMVRTRNAWYRIDVEGVHPIHHRILDRSSPNDIIKLRHNQFAFSPIDKWLYIFSYEDNSITIIDSFTTTGTVWSARELHEGTYLLGTTNGIVHSQEEIPNDLIGQEVHKFSLRNNEPFVAITSEGLMLKEASGNWKQYGKEIGLEGNYSDRTSVVIMKNQVWIGSDHGLLHFNLPSTNALAAKTPTPYILRTWINDRPWPKGLLLDQDSLRLNYDESTIEVDISAIQPVGAATPDITYKLNGYQTKWVKLRGGNNIRFTQVPPGSYQLEIALGDSEKIPEQSISITIIIQPPYWQTWWFRTLAALASIGIFASVIGLSYRRRLMKEQQKRERERMIADERDRIGKELHDDLGGELATILFLSQREARKQPSSNSSRIVELTKASLANMRDIIWALEGNDTTLGGLITYTQRYASNMCSDRNINFQMNNQVPPKICAKELGPRSRRNLFLITKEAINNSLKHSQTPSIELTYSHSGADLKISITDTGQGFDPDTIQTGNGMKNLKSRTHTLSGTCEIKSTITIGTTVIVEVPLV